MSEQSVNQEMPTTNRLTQGYPKKISDIEKELESSGCPSMFPAGFPAAGGLGMGTNETLVVKPPELPLPPEVIK